MVNYENQADNNEFTGTIKVHSYNCLISVWHTHYEPAPDEVIHCTCNPRVINFVNGVETS
jgi:hypothetical protein